MIPLLWGLNISMMLVSLTSTERPWLLICCRHMMYCRVFCTQQSNRAAAQRSSPGGGALRSTFSTATTIESSCLLWCGSLVLPCFFS